MTVEQADPIEAVRKKRLAKGTWKAERRRLLNLEKKVCERVVFLRAKSILQSKHSLRVLKLNVNRVCVFLTSFDCANRLADEKTSPSVRLKKENASV